MLKANCRGHGETGNSTGLFSCSLIISDGRILNDGNGWTFAFPTWSSFQKTWKHPVVEATYILESELGLNTEL